MTNAPIGLKAVSLALLCTMACAQDQGTEGQGEAPASTMGTVGAMSTMKPAVASSGAKQTTSAQDAAKAGSAGRSSASTPGAGQPSTSTAGASAGKGAAAPASASSGVVAGTSGAAQPGAGSAGNAAVSGSGAPATAGLPTEKFSFFITSLQGMRELSKSENGFGGDLRYGEATGLAGADKICAELAESSMPGAGAKGWHAFLSAAKGGPNDGPVHAKDRIGAGPWYDRLGRLVAMTQSDLLQQRPSGADPVIKDDLPNERGEPNHTDTLEGMDDNHDVVTATNQQGMWDGKMTCQDWTSQETPMMMPMGSGGQPQDGPFGGGRFSFGGPGLGHSWPSDQSGASWVAAHPAPGCGASVALVQTGPGMGTGIGNAGGYGAIYCFALKP